MYNPNDHPRDKDGRFANKATVYATPNRTYDSRRSCERKFERFEQDIETFQPVRHGNSVGVWDADMERSRTYEFEQFSEQDWRELQDAAQEMCDTWAQDSILLTRENPEGKSQRYTFDGVDVDTAAKAFRFLAKTDPNKGKDGYYGFGGTYRDGRIEVIQIDGDPTTEENVDRLNRWLKHQGTKTLQRVSPCDAKLVFNSDPERQRRLDERNKERFTANGDIKPYSGDSLTDPQLSNTIEQMREWSGEIITTGMEGKRK